MSSLSSSLSLTEPAIILAAFGTTVPSARQVYERFESLVRDRLPEHSIRWTFTSSVVRKRLLEEGREILDPLSTLAQVAREGYHNAVVQSLHVTPGEEYTRLLSLVQDGLDVQFGKPLMHKEAAIDRILQLLKAEVRDAAPTVLVAHGNGQSEFDGWYRLLIDRARLHLPEVILASLEGFPGPEPLERIHHQVTERGDVHFIPLLLVAGDHVINDIMGESEESWKNRLNAQRVSCAPPLGERAEVLEIFLEHLIDAVTQSKVGL